MSQKYDPENMLTDLRKILVENINAAIDAVEAEKIAQGLPATGVSHVDTTLGDDGYEVGFFEQDWSDEILNTSPAIYYGVEALPAVGVGPATSQTIEMFVEVVHVDSGHDRLRNRRTGRYTRAIKDVIENNWDQFPGSNKIKIKTIRPFSFKLDENSSEEVRVGGVSITTALA